MKNQQAHGKGKRAKKKTSENLNRMEQGNTFPGCPGGGAAGIECKIWRAGSKENGVSGCERGWGRWVLSCILESMLVGTSCSQLKAKYDKRKFCAEPRAESGELRAESWEAQRHPNRKEAALRCATLRCSPQTLESRLPQPRHTNLRLAIKLGKPQGIVLQLQLVTHREMHGKYAKYFSEGCLNSL